MIVVDTNIIACLVIASDQTPFAEDVFAKDSEWAVPWLWRSEMRNILTVYLRRNSMSLDDAKVSMARAELTVLGREYEVHSIRVLELAEASGCTAYDCEFVYVAERMDVPLITSDKKLLASFPDRAISMIDFAA